MNLGFANILILLLFSPKTNEQRRMAIGVKSVSTQCGAAGRPTGTQLAS